MADDRAPLFTVDLGTHPAEPADARPAASRAAVPVLHDAHRPPRWFARGLAMAVVAVFAGLLAWGALSSLTGLLLNLVLAFFLALVLEPGVIWLVRHGWRRAAATGVAMATAIALVLGIVALFGKLFVEQLVQLFDTLPQAYEDVRDWASEALGVTLPASQDVVQNALARYGNDVASGAWLVGTTLLGWVFSLATILLVTYYLSSAGPRFRRAVCSWLPPERQSEMLRLWGSSR